MTPLDLYRNCRSSARRLETLQEYAGGGERQRAYLADGTLAPPGPDKAADLELITELHRTGRYVGRVHVVEQPLTDYLRYELAAYAENVAAGEDVLIADRSAYPELRALGKDFALFDSKTALLFDYDEDGRVRGYHAATDRGIVEDCIRQYVLAVNRAVPLADFLAAAIL